MASPHTTFRELVAHLGRAQRAFDAGRFDEADRALDAALAIDPLNVQAADLRHRIPRDRERGHVPGAEAPRGRPVTQRSAVLDRRAWSDRAVPRAPRSAETGLIQKSTAGVSPAAWSAFEQRIRERRTARALSIAHAALTREDGESARAALAELDAVSPGDPRRTEIAARLPEPSGPALAWDEPGDGELAGETAAEAPWHATASAQPRSAHSKTAVRVALLAVATVIGAWMYGGWSAASLDPPVEITAPSSTADATTPSDVQDGAGDDQPTESLPGDPPSGDVSASDGADASAPDTAAPGANPPAVPFLEPTATPATASAQPDDSDAGAADARGPAVTAQPTLSSGAPSMEPSILASAEPMPPLEGAVQFPIAPPQALGPGAGQNQVTRATAPVPVPPVTPPAAPPAAPTTAATGIASRPAPDTSAVLEALAGYADAFSALDASATQRVWPGADLQGLRRAFDQLSAQTISFRRCDVNAAGDVAEAVCTGRQGWVPKVGDRTPRSEERTWRFALGREGREWVIDRVQVLQR